MSARGDFVSSMLYRDLLDEKVGALYSRGITDKKAIWEAINDGGDLKPTQNQVDLSLKRLSAFATELNAEAVAFQKSIHRDNYFMALEMAKEEIEARGEDRFKAVDSLCNVQTKLAKLDGLNKAEKLEVSQKMSVAQLISKLNEESNDDEEE